MDVVVDEAQKAVVLQFRKGDVVKSVPVPMPMWWGTYSDAETYRKGNVVQRGGSGWIAMKDGVKGIRPDDKTTEGLGAWRLFIQRGKEGKPGPRGETGAPGRDMRWEPE